MVYAIIYAHFDQKSYAAGKERYNNILMQLNVIQPVRLVFIYATRMGITKWVEPI